MRDVLACLQVKLFTDFYQSDVIVASPLGIATRLADGRDDGSDFLAAVEVTLALRADVMLMQNWAHVEAAFGVLNQLPKQQHGADIMRVRCVVSLFSCALLWHVRSCHTFVCAMANASQFNHAQLAAVYWVGTAHGQRECDCCAGQG